ncbi:microviridin/marinostatin family tricyclic proteinase inhibitor [Phormidium sp. LEGE 05292]|uniref:microviridin/marinostatin family tricyclic proteinase inhibitor n=1 Tax=[Phormidium] sp. LEGE 05292 TaxID=767427 RepID=UPI00187F37A3|nr:microviridin/marinostatin family tricyclic proteinase inhibitor [Phormidium sp. LEGE 05292]MBE9227621.1 microviridin/marinostatin family tricyclic proteinase inhibitor [Phormidium sp. LEGE 05292]
MSTEIVTDSKAVPFFARFLDDSMSIHQADEKEQPAEPSPTPPFPSIPPIFTFKYPSDWEDF